MVKIPKELKYTETHEWVKIEEDIATIGITDYAQRELSDIVFVELPSKGKSVKKGEPFGTIEAVKAAADLYSGVSGKVIEINEELKQKPELINQDPYGKGWMVKIKISDPSQIPELLSAEQYEELIKKEEH